MNTKTPIKINMDQNYSADATKALLEQYKIYVDSASKVSDRRGAANTFLMTANTALVTVFGLVAGRDVVLSAAPGHLRLLVPLAGLTICIAWFALIRTYRALNTAKFNAIQDLEEHLPAQIYRHEWNQLNSGQLHTPLTYVELVIPLVFGAIYAGLILGAAC